MPDEATTSVELPRPQQSPVRAQERPHLPVSVKLHVRVRHGVRKPHNWFQLIRFGAVGTTGYVVNLAVFALCVHAAGIDYRISAVIAWIVSVLNNFWWNRHWTFAHSRERHPVEQGLKFFAVSLVAYGFSYVVLVSLVDGAGFEKVVAQAISVAAATPLSFVGQKLWSFRSAPPRS
jgi:dolichol-phosphate mannosyltransferase